MRSTALSTVSRFRFDAWGQPPKFDPQSPKLAHVVNGWWVNAKIRELIQSKEIGLVPGYSGARYSGEGAA